MSPGARLAVMLPRDLDPDRVVGFARAVEDAGFDATWVVEDLGFRGGFAQAGAVLASTTRLEVGLGIAPVGARVPEFAAMEAATLAQLFPGRFSLGVGHGMPAWMRAVGAWPSSPLGALERYLVGLRAMLGGSSVDDRPVLEPGCVPARPPALLAGVRGPRSLAVSGRLADGTVLAEPVTPEYVARVREALGNPPGHRIVAYHLACVRDDVEEAAEVLRPALAVVGEPDWAPHVDPLPFADDLRARRSAAASAASFAADLPLDWVRQLALAGPPDAVRARLDELTAAGVTEHVLVPAGPDVTHELQRFAALVTPAP